MTRLLTSAALALVLTTGAALAQSPAPAPGAPAPSVSAPAPKTATTTPAVKADPANDAKFKSLDKNANGVIEGSELSAVTAELAKIDTDKDGKISRAEFDVAIKAGIIK